MSPKHLVGAWNTVVLKMLPFARLDSTFLSSKTNVFSLRFLGDLKFNSVAAAKVKMH